MPISSALGSSALLPAGLGFRNTIINGNMAIDQRNSGSSITATVNGGYGLDRWGMYLSAASKFSLQRLTSTPPAGFAYYQRVTSLAATADTSGAYYTLNQVVEGFNMAQFGWGTSGAKPVTLSFWVRSSLTGTFGGAIRNAGSGGWYTYSFTYTINAANTWEYKTISIPGVTSGGWDTSNGAGLYLFFDLGCNSSETQAAGAWNNVNKLGANGCVRVIGTNAATWDITGVQLEQNYQPTPFEQRPYGVELALCQRYFQIFGTSSVEQGFGASYFNSAVYIALWVARFITQMRAAPGITFTTPGNIYNVNTGTTYTGVGWVLGSTSDQTFYVYTTTAIGTANGQSLFIYGQRFSLSAEL
jgi:hypothetical protein